MTAKPSTEAEIRAAMLALPGWLHTQGAMVRTYRFADFRDAVAFLSRAAFECEELRHHPELKLVYGTVEVRLTTHDAGNVVTHLDLTLARHLERHARRFVAPT